MRAVQKSAPAGNRTGTQINAGTVARARVDREQHNTGGMQPDRRGNRPQQRLPDLGNQRQGRLPDQGQTSRAPGRTETLGTGYSGGMPMDIPIGESQSDIIPPGGLNGVETGGWEGIGEPLGQPYYNQPVIPTGDPNQPMPSGGNGVEGHIDNSSSAEVEWARQFAKQYGAFPPGYEYLEGIFGIGG